MQEVAKLCSGIMATVIGLNEEQLQGLCVDAASHVPHGHEIICIGNYLFDRGYVISGSLQAVWYHQVYPHKHGLFVALKCYYILQLECVSCDSYSMHTYAKVCGDTM